MSVDKDFIDLVQGRLVEQWVRTIDGGSDKGSWLEYPWLVKFQVVTCLNDYSPSSSRKGKAKGGGKEGGAGAGAFQQQQQQRQPPREKGKGKGRGKGKAEGKAEGKQGDHWSWTVSR